ncbi:MAG: glycosyltransferase [Parcubacteria group bacterium]
MADVQSIILYFTLFTSLFFEIFLLITYFEVREEIKFDEEHRKMSPGVRPSVTIIVPSFNEERTVAGTIKSILNLSYPKDKLKLILIDDGSTDNTLKTLNKFKTHPQVTIYSKENGGKHTALNFALEKVETDLVGCLDADSYVNQNALEKIMPFFEDEKIMAVTPSIKVHEPKTILQHVQKVEYSWGVFLRRMLSSMEALYVTPGPFSIFRTRVFKELGGYRVAHQTEDMEMALRMQKNRYRIVNALGAHVYTVTPGKLKDLYKQRLRWTYGFLNNAMDYRELFLNKKYGHIGLFILPLAFISIFTTLYAAGSFLWNMASKALDTYSKHQAIGWTFQSPSFSFDWFFINTGAIALITVAVLALTLYLLFLALRIANGPKLPGREVLYYLAVYMFIVPLWLASAVYNTVFSRKVSWR